MTSFSIFLKPQQLNRPWKNFGTNDSYEAQAAYSKSCNPHCQTQKASVHFYSELLDSFPFSVISNTEKLGLGYYRIKESQNVRGWKGPLWVI